MQNAFVYCLVMTDAHTRLRVQLRALVESTRSTFLVPSVTSPRLTAVPLSLSRIQR